MGCISSVPEEPGVGNINIEANAHRSQSSLSNQSNTPPLIEPDHSSNNNIHASLEQNDSPPQLRDWTTNDLISHLSTIDGGRFSDPKYEHFKTQLQALGIDGNTIHTLCYDPYYLKDLGLEDGNDIILIQTECVQLYSNSDHNEPIPVSTNDTKEQNNDSIALEEDREDFIPLDWQFPLEDSEHIKNHYYVSQRLIRCRDTE
eukprot:406828_1